LQAPHPERGFFGQNVDVTGLRIVQKRYEVGMTTFVDVLGAENALIRARTNALQALYDSNIAHAELKLAAGTL